MEAPNALSTAAQAAGTLIQTSPPQWVRRAALRTSEPPAQTWGPDLDEETRSLLYRRLRLCAVALTMGPLALLVAGAVAGRGTNEDVADGGFAASASVAIVGLVSLAGLRRSASLPRLRVIEVWLFGSLSLVLGILRYLRLLELPPASTDPRHP